MTAVWPWHKLDCNTVVATTKYFQSIGDPEASGVSCMLPTEDVLRLDDLSIAIYQKYGVDELPDHDSELDEDKKLALFLGVLRENDTCTPVNRARPLPEKLLLNRYYNGMYERAKDIFTPTKFAQLDAQIKADHVGMATH
ncbi:hypothetical protein PRNP1_007265 [Phytophthora ramorum]